MDFANDENKAIVSKALALNRKARTILLEIDETNFPTENSHEARDLVLKFLDEIRKPSVVNNVAPAALYNRHHALMDLVRKIELSSTREISWPLVSYYDAIWSRLFPADGPLLFYSQTLEYNYSISQFNKHIEHSLRGILSSTAIQGIALPTDIYCLELASVENDNLPLYANIGHEFGHAVFNERHAEVVGLLSSATSKLCQDLESDLQSLGAANSKRRMQKLGYAIYGIGKELFCDLIGCYLMGPAFYFSLYEIAWGGNRDYFPVTISPQVNRSRAYPSTNFRLEKIKSSLNLEELKVDGKKLLSDSDSTLNALLDLVTTVPSDHSTDSIRVRPREDVDRNELENVLTKRMSELKASLDQFWVDCESKLGNWFPNINQPRVQPNEIVPLLQRIDSKILPNVIPDSTLLGKRASFPAILNSSALYRLGKLLKGDADKQDDLANDIELVERLTSKSFEVSYMHKEFLDWKSKQ